MSMKECKFCDQCGKQMTVYDSDGDAVHSGLEVKGDLSISETQKTDCGTSYRGVFDTQHSDLCSISCLKKRFSKLLAEMGE